MIPATLGTLLGFLGLVAPGLVYRAVVERRRSRERESTFAEASRVGLTSLIFSLASLILLWLLQRYESPALYRYTRLALPNIGRWLTGGNKYVAGNLGKVFFGLAAEVILACALAAAAAWLFAPKSRSRVTKDTIYRTVFSRYAPDGFTPWVYVRLDDKTEFWGHYRAHDDRDGAGVRAIVLAGDTLMRQRPDEDDWQPVGENWDIVVIDAAKIQYIQVIYRGHGGELRGAWTGSEKEGRARAVKPAPVASPAGRVPPEASEDHGVAGQPVAPGVDVQPPGRDGW